MIPKKIHLCWLSGDKIPLFLLKCINSWKRVMPEYEIIYWDKKKFNIESIPFVHEACSKKKWAFAADYIRLYAIYTEGGIYFDSDVLLMKKLDEFLVYDFFSAVEYHPQIFDKFKGEQFLNSDGTSKHQRTPIPGIGIQAAVLGGIKGHPFFKNGMDYYKDKRFILNDGSLNDRWIAPAIYAITAEKYGFKYIDKLQRLRKNMLILPSKCIAPTPDLASDESYAIHYCEGSWRDIGPVNPINKVVNILADQLKSNNLIRKLFRKPIIEKNLWK
jgi:mannosyltransferase OCH1-like enzyme